MINSSRSIGSLLRRIAGVVTAILAGGRSMDQLLKSCTLGYSMTFRYTPLTIAVIMVLLLVPFRFPVCTAENPPVWYGLYYSHLCRRWGRGAVGRRHADLCRTPLSLFAARPARARARVLPGHRHRRGLWVARRKRI